MSSYVLYHNLDALRLAENCSLALHADIYFIQAFFIASTKALALDGCLSVTFLFRIVHRFSIRLRSGLFLGHSIFCHLCHRQINLNFFQAMERSMLVH